MTNAVRGLRGLLLALCIMSMPACSGSEENPNTAPSSEAQGPKRYLPFDCGMGTCFVTEVKSVEMVGQNDHGKLYKAVLLGGEIPDQYVSGEMLQPDKVVYGNGREEFVFCSTTLPMAIFERDGKFEANLLAFGGAIPHARYSSANLYTMICHPGEKWDADDFASRHGYTFGIGDEMQLILEKPENVLALSPPERQSPPLVLSNLSEADWDVLETGCSCSFTSGKDVLLALGHNAAVFRTKEGPRVCSPGNDPFEQAYKGNASLDCGQTKIQITAGSDKVANGDGYDASSKLTIVEGGRRAEASGKVSCMC